ncbi:MAG: AAA family ATPase [Acidimicrobiaceae bacterium]|nr:AAA family ATPase [Acidimicrobiaceae bacterium]
MTGQDWFATAQRPSSGAHFYKCALQVNPHHYSGTFRGQASGDSSLEYAQAIIAEAVALEVSVLAITDHNSVSSIHEFRAAAEGHQITIFPGFEIASSEGVHILCIYPPDTAAETLERFLGELGIRSTEPSSDLSSDPFAQILQKVRAQGGVTVAAHVTGSKGLFEVLEGQACIRAWRNEDLLAIQIPGPVSALPDKVRQIVNNKNHDYRRSHAVGVERAVATVNAKDIRKPEDLHDPSATSWIKMSEVSIEGLRQAFLDPDSRIRLNSDPEPEEHAELVTLEWNGGFLDGAAVHFNPNLNVLIGGRGAGKSTVIESLRHVLNLEPTGEDALKAHTGMVRQVIRSGTKITLRTRVFRPAEREYLIERTVPNPAIVRESNGQISNLSPRDILPNVDIYGQHEISELAKSPEKRTVLIDRFVPRDESLNRQKTSVIRSLQQTRKSIVDARAEIEQIDEQLAKLPGLEETLERYKEAGLENRLRERSLLVREERLLDSIPERISVFRECLDALRQELPIDRAFLSEKALEELPGKEILASADPVLEQLSREIEASATLIEKALEQAHDGVTGVIRRWSVRKGEVESEYQQILRELQKSAVDGAEFIRLQREIEALRPLRDRRTSLDRLETDCSEQRRALLAEWEDLKAREFRGLDRAAKSVSSDLRDRVQVSVTASGNREPLSRLLREEIGGRLSEAIDKLEQAPDFSLTNFVKCCRDGSDALQRAYSIPAAQAISLTEATADTLMRVEELELPPTTDLELNTAAADDPPYWQALEDLSTGQKATAVLLLLLLESDAPLIVDQPEDDLDNRFITEVVVPRMREEKRRRQFLFSTHNANIPVLGDAELILGLTASGDADNKGKAVIRPEHTGSIDVSGVRELVEEILEGGKNAFETRRLKYGF